MDPDREGDNIRGIAYNIDRSTLPGEFFDDVEFSQTTMTISSAELRRTNGRHGGGTIVIQPGATIKKEHPNRGQGQGSLRGNGNSASRRLAQTMGNRYVHK